MFELFRIPGWLVRNPLGIIALFISLIYGMSAILLGATIQRLALWNQTTLVIFVVIFPFAVLAVFAWLVIAHHRKLYGPGDFRSDESFLSASTSAPAESVGARLIREIEDETVLSLDTVNTGEQLARQEVSVNKDTNNDAPVSFVEEGSDQNSRSKKTVDHEGTNEMLPAKRGGHSTGTRIEPDTVKVLIAQTYLLEGLVLQELQRELGGAVLREVEVRLATNEMVHVDGLFLSSAGEIAVEIKVVSGFFQRAIDNAVGLIRKFETAALKSPSFLKPIRLIYVFVMREPGSVRVRERLAEISQCAKFPVDVRIYKERLLLEKYGLSQIDITADRPQ